MAMTSPTVLYVEDEEDDILFMQRAFKKAGLQISLQTVEDGQAAIDYLSGTGSCAAREQYPLPKVVLLDLNLPKVSGFEVLQWIRNQPDYKSMPVVVFSSSSRDEDQARAKALGANDYWEKPNSALLFGNAVKGLTEKWL